MHGGGAGRRVCVRRRFGNAGGADERGRGDPEGTVADRVRPFADICGRPYFLRSILTDWYTNYHKCYLPWTRGHTHAINGFMWMFLANLPVKFYS